MDNCRKCRVTRLKLRARPPFFICLLCCGVSVTCSDDSANIHTIDDSTLTLASTCGDICRYEDFFQRAHCDERKMTFIPTSTGCENATLLELQRNSITKITSDEMFGFKNVRTLDLSQNVSTAVTELKKVRWVRAFCRVTRPSDSRASRKQLKWILLSKGLNLLKHIS